MRQYSSLLSKSSLKAGQIRYFLIYLQRCNLSFMRAKIVYVNQSLAHRMYRVYKKNATSEFPKKSTLQFLSIKYFRPLGIEIELLIDHITVVVH
jgi:hypothetical protein